MRRRTVGIVGARGINNYGGYERMLADLVHGSCRKGTRFAAAVRDPQTESSSLTTKGRNSITSRSNPRPTTPCEKRSSFFTISFFILKYAAVCDVVYVLGIYGGVALLFPRLFGKHVVVNTDGLEWERAKYNTVERSIIVLYFAVSLNLASKIIIDNEGLRRFISARHHSKICYIPYGVAYQQPRAWDKAKLGQYISEQLNDGAIEPSRYWLLVARLEPENNIDLIVQGFVEAHPQYPLLVVGDFTSQRYKTQVYRGASNGSSAKVHFLGAIYDAGTLSMLRQHCLACIHGHSVGGTNPSLLEAMASRNLIIAHENPFNKEVCGPFAHYFSSRADVSNLVASTEQNEDDSSLLRGKAFERAAAYSWNSVADQYDVFFEQLSEKDSASLASGDRLFSWVLKHVGKWADMPCLWIDEL